MTKAAIDPKDLSWPFWPIVPLYPYGQRRTIRHEVVKDTIWTFEQLQGIFYVIVPIRMTVIKLESGGLFVYAPVAPTAECIRLMRELESQHGAVKYIILPTISGIEHKVFVGPFSRCFPEAIVYVTPNQWSFPINLPLSWLGLPTKRTEILPDDPKRTALGKEFSYEILPAINLKVGYFSEVAFFHHPSQTLLLTDGIISIPENPPAILELDTYPLLFHAKNSAKDRVEDTPENRRRGWQRICLFALYFQPPVLAVPNWIQVFREALTAKEKDKKSYFGLFPFQWDDDWQKTFLNLRRDGGLIVAPILQTLILNRAPQEVSQWVDRVAQWPIKQVIPCHFASPIQADSQEFKQAFSFLLKDSYLPKDDLECLQSIDDFLVRWRLTPPPDKKL
jgi:Domain of unknown function (DUF4336)